MTNREELRRLAERGEPWGADELIARLESRLEGRPVVGDGRSRTEPARRHSLGWSALVAAAVLLLVGAVALFGPMFDDDRPASPGTVPDGTMTTVDATARDASEAIGLAEAYIEALNAYDAVAVRALLSPEAFVKDSQWEGLHELEMGVEANRVFGLRFEPFECGPNPLRPDPGNVLCSYTLQTMFHRITGERLLRSAFDIRVSDGLIVWAHNIFPLPDIRPAFEPFHDWLKSHDSGAPSRLHYNRPVTQYWTPILTPEALAEAAVWLAEYEQWASEQ